MERQVYNETVQRELETHYKAVLALLGKIPNVKDCKRRLIGWLRRCKR